MNMHEIRDSIYKRLEEIGLYTNNTGNRRRYYYSNPCLQNNGYDEKETEIQIVFVDWMGSLTEMWVNHDFRLHPVWYKIIKNNLGRSGPKLFGVYETEKMFDCIKQQISQLDRLVTERNEKLAEERKQRKKEEIMKSVRNWNT